MLHLDSDRGFDTGRTNSLRHLDAAEVSSIFYHRQWSILYVFKGVIFDYAERYTDARKKISQWIDNGSLKLPEFVCDGDIEDFPSAFKKLFEGKNFGKMLLKLPAAK